MTTPDLYQQCIRQIQGKTLSMEQTVEILSDLVQMSRYDAMGASIVAEALRSADVPERLRPICRAVRWYADDLAWAEAQKEGAQKEIAVV